MKAANNAERKKKIVAFGLILSLSVGLILLLTTALWQNNIPGLSLNMTADKSSKLLTQNNKLAGYDELLHSKMNELQKLDQQYALTLTDTSNAAQLDSMDKFIHLQDENFRALVDNVNLKTTEFNDENVKGQFTNMIAAFRSVINYRRTLASLRNAASTQAGAFNPDEKAMLKMQDELLQKDNSIAALESSIQSLQRSKPAAPAINATNNDNTAALIDNISTLENKLAAIQTANNNLKQENDRLQKQTDISRTMSSNNEQALNEKAATLQQKVNTLATELQLARVDCNLSRADATQIISNSRQRKQLLSEASSILTDLSATADTEVKRKVKDKIIRLNTVAANARD